MNEEDSTKEPEVEEEVKEEYINIFPELPLTEWEPPETKLSADEVIGLVDDINGCENVAELVSAFKAAIEKITESPIFIAIKAAVAG